MSCLNPSVLRIYLIQLKLKGGGGGGGGLLNGFF